MARSRIEAIGFALAIAGLSVGLCSFAQAQTKDVAKSAIESGDDLAQRLKEAEREREELKKRNAALEQRLKALQASVDDQVRQALSDEAAPRPFALPPSARAYGRRPVGPFISQFRPMYSPFGGTPDPVELAIGFSDALGEKEAAKPALEAAQKKLEMGRDATRFDVDAATAKLLRADRKVRLLRNIITTARAVAADDVERMRKLGAVRAVAADMVHNSEARLKILDEILATDPESAAKPANSPAPAEPK